MEEGPNDSTTESKKETNASSSGLSDGKSEQSSPVDAKDNELLESHNFDRYPLNFDYEINHLKEFNTDYFENKPAAIAFNKINSVLNSYPESLSHCDLSNECSQPVASSQTLFNTMDTPAHKSTVNLAQDHFLTEKEADKIDNMAHFQRRGEDDVQGAQRNEFAHKYLFSGPQNISSVPEESDMSAEDSYYSDDDSNVSAYD